MNLTDTRKFQILGGILIFIIIVILLYLKNNSYFQSMLMKSVPAPTPTPSIIDDNIIIPGNRGEKDNLTSKAKTDLAQKLNIQEKEISVKNIEKKDWSDSSLGCPKPGMMYAQVITPGYLITLEAGGQEYNYHTSSEIVSLCQR
ncbi:hypothetical protein A2773_03920 [Candidatus Gottesmanbacteria bacterium RIFCSPHIGHO2_01_FULL_39_10]|uniref:Uncharacterized protein n=1 Tax=Candidatus Gottesmanbacteria bacterium RIFCSPHIGHO2_01_FULL_39_10 TaxID=1798375 RepID=A0A1F5ZQX5_9BACT|nr:MAG: hypothetical protein A2773_03920 [Candidatus Gottesmanbacteria bacterium RIFCSPHIGHO2_01_FULL_39_10]